MFYVSILKINKVPNGEAMASLGINCRHLEENYWIMEGIHETLSDAGIEYEVFQEDIVVESLGDFNPHDLKGYIEEVSNWKRDKEE